MLLMRRQKGPGCGGEAPLWEQPWGHRWESRTIPLPQLRFLPAAPWCQLQRAFCLQKGLSERHLHGFLEAGGNGIISFSGQWELPQILGGEDVQWSSHTGAAERRRVTDWKPQRNLPGGTIHPEIKDKGSLAVDPHGFHSKCSAFAMLRQNSCW